MATPFQFKSAETSANAMLKADKAKVQWAKLPISTLPTDLAKLAADACIAECLARRAMLDFKAAMEDKIVPPAGRKFIFAVERGVTDPNLVGDMLFAEVAGSTGTSTTVTSFDALTKKYA